MANRITTAVAVEGESQYKQAIKECSSALSVLKSELEANKSEFRNNADSMEAMASKGEILNRMFEQQQEKVSQMAQAYAAARSAQQGYGEDIDRLRGQLDEANAALKAMEDAGEGNSQAAAELREQIAGLSSELETSQAYYDAATSGVNKWQKELNYATVGLNDMADQIAANNAALNESGQAAEEASESMHDFGDAAGEGSSGSDLMSMAISGLVGAISGAGLISLLKEAASAVFEFAKETQEAEAIIVQMTGATGDALKGLSDSMMNAFAQTDTKNLDDVATAIGELNTRLKITGPQLEENAAAFVTFADNMNSSVPGAIENVSKIIKNWNLDVNSAVSILDMLVVAAQNSGASVDELSGALVQNKSLFLEMGYSLEESLGFLANLEDAGLNATQVMTGMRQAITKLTESGGDLRSNLDSAIREIERMGDTSEATAAAIDLFGGKAGMELANAIKNGRIELSAWVEKLENSAGALERTDQAADTFADKMQQAANKIKASGYDVATGILNVKNSVDELTTAARDNSLDEVAAAVARAGYESQAAAEHAYALVDTLADMGAAGKTASDGTGKYADAVARLAATVPGLNLVINEQSGLLEQNTETLRQNVEAWQREQDAANALTYAEAAIENYNAKVEELERNKASLAEETENVNRITERQAIIFEELAERFGITAEAGGNLYSVLADFSFQSEENAAAVQEYWTELQALSEQLDAATANQERYAAAINICSDAVAQAEQTMEAAKAAYEEISGTSYAAAEAANTAAAAYDDLDTAYSSFVSETSASIAELQAQLDEASAAWEAHKEATLRSIEAMYGPMEKLPDVMTHSADEVKAQLDSMTEALNTQAKFWDDYATNIETALARGVDEGLVRKLSDGSREGAEQLAALASASDTEIQNVNNAFKNLSEAQSTAAETFTNIETDFKETCAALEEEINGLSERLNVAEKAYDAGAATINSYAQAARDSIPDVETAFGDVAKAAVAAFTGTLNAGLNAALQNAGQQVGNPPKGSGGNGNTYNFNISGGQNLTPAQMESIADYVNTELAR